MLALTIYVFFFLKRYEKKLKAARILSEDKADTSEKTEKPTVLFRPSFKKIDPVDVYWIICLNYVYVQSSYQNTFSYYITTLLKGQSNSEWIHEFIVSPKMPTKNYKDFCPTKQSRIVAKKTAYNHQKKCYDP